MVVDFKALKAKAKEEIAVKPLFLCLIGPSGSGKSTACGTMGVPTLMLYTATERHGATNARAIGGDITDVDFTVRRADGLVDADASIKNLHEILSSPGLDKEFGAVVIDSATELQLIHRRSNKFSNYCKNDKGIHNNFKESEADTAYFKEVLEDLVVLNNKGVHVVMTCAAIVKSLADDGSVSEASPSLQGFSVAHDLLRNFSDILLVSRLVEEDGEGGSRPQHKFIFRANVSKTSKDVRGQVLKTANFSPRISGLLLDKLPETTPADLGKIIAARLKRLGGK
jgi:adenylate kinase family enzyme